MTDIFAGSGDGTVQNSNANFSTARGSATTSGGTHDNTSSTVSQAILNVNAGFRGTNNFKIARAYFPFDLSGESGTVTAATLSIGLQNTGHHSTVYAVEATALAGGVADFGNVFSSGTTLGTLFASGTAGAFASTDTDLTINSDGITAINNAIGSGTLTIGLMGHNDYQNLSPSNDGSSNYSEVTIFMSERGGTGYDPTLTLTFGSVSGYGHKVLGVAAGSIGKVNGVATANIGKVNSVD